MALPVAFVAVEIAKGWRKGQCLIIYFVGSLPRSLKRGN